MAAMGRPRTVVGERATTDRLLLAAEDVFAASGYEGARLEDIAGRVGISRPSLLYHFKTKKALYDAVILNVFAELGVVLRRAVLDEGSFASRLDRILVRFNAFLERRPSAARLVLREVLDDQGPGQALLRERGVPLLQFVERFVREEGGETVRSDVPIMDALLHLVTNSFVKVASGALGRELWGPVDHSTDIARILFLARSA